MADIIGVDLLLVGRSSDCGSFDQSHLRLITLRDTPQPVDVTVVNLQFNYLREIPERYARFVIMHRLCACWGGEGGGE